MIIKEADVINIMQAVLDMRDAQKKYFAQQCSHNLKISFAKESIVDNNLQHFIKAGLIKSKPAPGTKPTPELFT
jgi:hypothetical protein